MKTKFHYSRRVTVLLLLQILSLNIKSRHDANFVATVGTAGCHDNLQYHHQQKKLASWQFNIMVAIKNIDFYLCSVHENHRTHRTFPMARPKCPMRDFTNFNRIYKAHRTNVWCIMKVFRVHCLCWSMFSGCMRHWRLLHWWCRRDCLQNLVILIKISMKLVPRVQYWQFTVDSGNDLVPCNKPLPGTVMIQFTDAICCHLATLSWWFNSLRLGDGYMHHWIGTSLVHVMACHLFCTKPLPEPMITYCQVDP